MVAYLLQQRAVLGPLFMSVAESLLSKPGEQVPASATGRVVTETVPPRQRDLVDAYIRHVGGDPSSYRGVLPPHMFPQWAMPAAAKTLRGVNLPLTRIINAGSSLEIRGPLPSNVPLLVRARLDRVDNNGRRIVLEQLVETGPKEQPDALVARIFAYLPLAQKGKGGAGGRAEEKARPLVPASSRELLRFRVQANAGLKFAALTGDINPIHWSRPYARAFGFPRPILHGFSAMARAVEGMTRGLFSGDPRRLGRVSVRFVRPIPLPLEVGLYVDGSNVFLGEARGGAAYLTGEYHAAAAEPLNAEVMEPS